MGIFRAAAAASVPTDRRQGEKLHENKFIFIATLAISRR
jgi:hypothetical protein